MKSLTRYTTEIKNNNKALVVYITAGVDGWVEAVHAAHDNGADIVEVGLPFSDPIMDGPVIAQASAIAISNGAKTLDLLQALGKENFEKPIVAMTYTNVLYAHGVKDIIEPLNTANITGLILPDLTFERRELFADVLVDTDISLISLVASTTSNERRQEIAKASEGFLYCIAIKGITGQNVDLESMYTDFISQIRSVSPVATYCGVGIRTPEDAKILSEYCDGVIIGTSIVEKMLQENNSAESVGNFVKEIRNAIDG